MGASRLPGKPLEMLGGKPLIIRVYEQARKAAGIDEVVVATDSQEILRAVEANGGRAVLTRSDHTSGSDRVAEAADLMGADLIINLQGDEPFSVPSDIEAVAAQLARSPDAIVTMDFKLQTVEQWQDPSVVKVVKSAEGKALYFSRSPIPFSHAGEDALTLARGHMGIYGYHREILKKMTDAPPAPLELAERLEQLRAMSIGIPIYVTEASGAPMGIDTPADLAEARERVQELGSEAFPG